ncbi:unnamed protein product [Allacma fusca]|uniref:Uncharacterized protein n=1 Tax=Allacma fusca TaxID=39272 RepID=A0A8J2PDS8_9HEXA|nr:unnamed protein product [Allacma fusca]
MESDSLNNPPETLEMVIPPGSSSSLGTEKELPKYLVQLDKRKSCAFIILLKDQHLETSQIKSITVFLKKEKIINPDSKCYVAVLEENVADDIYSGDSQIIFKNPADSSHEAILVIKRLGLTRSNLENLILPSPASPRKTLIDIKDITTVWKQHDLEGSFPSDSADGNVIGTCEEDHFVKDIVGETLEDQFSFEANNLERYSEFMNLWAQRLVDENSLPTNWTCCVTKRSEIAYDGVLNIFELDSNSSGIGITRSVQIFSDGSVRVFINPFTCTDIFIPDGSTIETLEAVVQIVSKIRTYHPCVGVDSVEQNPKNGTITQHGEKCDGKFDIGQTIYTNLENFWDELKIAEAAKEFKSLPAKERR